LSLGRIPPQIPNPMIWIPVLADKGTWIVSCHGFEWGVSPSDNNFENLTLQASKEVLLDTGVLDDSVFRARRTDQ
jgi:hypothetical protein